MIELTAAGYAAELKRFRATGSVWLAADEIPADVDVPAAWRALLATPDDMRADTLVQMWAGVTDRLPAVAQFFRDKLVRPAVFRRDGGDVVLLYPYTVGHDDLNFFIGRAPLGERGPDDEFPWTALPEALRRFHQSVHDGWTFFPANSMGPLPLADQAVLADKLDLTATERRKLGVNPDLVRAVFHNGSGDWLCVDSSDGAGSRNPAGRLWWHERPTELEPVDFWAVMNAWFEIFVDEADKR
ncbi:SMI1/KNR4 family protein [Burkholderia sp. Ac-20392]|uniref:SMI1/KNR4 family protein n=1 Tax=Burkholderia sp. Ac-20392 TaxID=2703905 RepID=UPI001980442F|nr:SMI1/KNR4 family protein [Burkholderia sp. Ac-20392]MBN3797820.1 SMI1/KNR4 family protein [Burkholderia sp. Ac-20392]